MANYQVQMFTPLEDASGAIVDTSSLITSLESIALGNITIVSQAVSIYKAGVYTGQGSMLLWVVADTNVATAISDYNTFVSRYTWGIVSPHYLAVLLGGVA
jgi:hypothetical protein